MKEVRTRFAPSPTGYLHVGGVRTALFAWLVARQAGGQFILRIEDTDRARHVEAAEKHIMDSLNWLGLKWDEGPIRQSEHLELYEKWARQLIEKGRAYADPYTPEELDKFREDAKQAKKPFLFRGHRPDDPPVWGKGMPLRFKSEPKAYQWHDEVMGDLSAGPEAIDDFIILKSDGFPTYNFAHIIDDHETNVSHVIRTQEFLPSVPKYLNLYEALEIKPPLLTTLPYVMAPDGKKKLSKRDGAKDVLDYKREGYLSEAIINFMASLGWNDGTEQEVFTVNELVKKFRLDRVQKSGARFDEERLKWLNGQYIRELEPGELTKLTKDFWPSEADNYDEKYKALVLGLVQERLKFLAELPELTLFFFSDLPINPELISGHKQLSKLPKLELKSLLSNCREALKDSDFKVADLTKSLNELLVSTNQKPVVLFSLIRIATTQAPASPELAPTLAVLGKEKTLSRIDRQVSSL